MADQQGSITRAQGRRVRTRRILENIGVALCYGVFGILAGSLGTAVHRQRFAIEQTVIWHGIALALLAIALTAIGLRWYLRDRLTSFAFAAGVLIAVQLLAMPGMGLSFIIPAAGGGIGVGEVWSIGAPIIAFLPAMWPDLRSARMAGGQSASRSRYPKTQHQVAESGSSGSHTHASSALEENRS